MIAATRYKAYFFLCLSLCLLSGCRKKSSSAPQAEAPQSTAQQAANPQKLPAAQAPITLSAKNARPTGPVHFTDVTAQAGIHFTRTSGAFGKKYLPETMGSGVCVIDYDGDGWQDLFFVNSKDWPGHPGKPSYPALYHNNHDGTFTDVTQQAGLAVQMYGMGCAVGDYDNDGHDDLYVTALDHNHLFRNLGHGRFKDVTAQAGVGSSGFSTSAAWFDYDNDGKLDLVVDHYVDWSMAGDKVCSLDGVHKSYCTPELYKGESITLYHNLGHGKFADVTRAAGVYDPTDKALGIALLDYDNDGWLDFLVTNDTQPNKLYHNNHNGTFTETGVESGVAYSDAGKSRAGMGADAADYDNSGRQGLVIGNFTNESIALYHVDKDGLFTDNAPMDGIASASARSLTFAAFFFDYNLDGLLDVLALNGHVADDVSILQPTLSYAEPPLLFRNMGHGKFENVSRKVGADFRRPQVGRGAAYADFDNDGDLDLVFSTSNGPARLLRNDGGNQNSMLRVRLIGSQANRDAIGAYAVLTTSTGQRTSEMVKSGSSYLSQSELPLTFGLGKPNAAERITLTIAWPGGGKEVLRDLHPDAFITVQQGRGVIASQPLPETPEPAK